MSISTFSVTRLGIWIATLGTLTACVINPVTGDRELALISAADEVAIGEQQYAPSQQMQGGDYTLDPALSAYVAGVGQKLAAVSDRDLPYEFAVLNSSVPNAWALPGGKIAVNRGLLMELQSEAELAAVLGHEIVHAAARHGALAMQRGLLLQGALLATAIAAQRGNYAGLAVGAASIGAQLISQRNSRGAELESDLYGMRYMSVAGYDPQAAVSLQETFVRLSQANGEQGRLATLFASHPPSAERVERNRQTAATLPSGGELGRERYQAATATLRQRRPAYESYDQGREALADDRIADAERLAAEAARLVPAEAQFHALLGDIDVERERFADAVGHYNDAIARNDRFFYYHLRKGITQQRLRQWDASAAALQTSIELLPTADAYYGLGRIAEQRGDRATALEHYARAAQSSTSAGQAAQDAAVRLDLPANPGKYLALRTALDSQGQLIVDLANPTRVPVADIVVTVRYADAQGAIRETSRQFSGQLPPNGVQRWTTGLGPFATIDATQVVVARARVIEQ
ncbi:MAG TPA: M48 family metalloprotease [Gammaproteobacteria bacterium]|nr:M48 family metalloprotease [Gammaproteobacteria bacterium]